MRKKERTLLVLGISSEGTKPTQPSCEKKNDLKISLFDFHLLRRITLTLDEWRIELNFPPSVNSSTVWLEDVHRAGDLRPTVKCEGTSFKDSGSEGACLTLTFQNCRSRVFFVSCLLKGAGSWRDVRADCLQPPFAWIFLALCRGLLYTLYFLIILIFLWCSALKSFSWMWFFCLSLQCWPCRNLIKNIKTLPSRMG